MQAISEAACFYECLYRISLTHLSNTSIIPFNHEVNGVSGVVIFDFRQFINKHKNVMERRCSCGDLEGNQLSPIESIGNNLQQLQKLDISVSYHAGFSY